jgi:hypothetical protein
MKNVPIAQKFCDQGRKMTFATQSASKQTWLSALGARSFLPRLRAVRSAIALDAQESDEARRRSHSPGEALLAFRVIAVSAYMIDTWSILESCADTGKIAAHQMVTNEGRKPARR